MIKMAQDFATPSLDISDESIKDADDAFSHYDLRRRWEDEVHPFVFFNEDRTTMTFINVNVNDNGDLYNADGSVCKRGMVSKRLVADLKKQGVPFGVKFNSLSRADKIATLCQFMNIPYNHEEAYEPDETYELTTDNVLKMLAIYMRLRCNIPVIVMGETGCGKTRMIEFMSKMRCGVANKNVKNMATLKIHGGITATDIYDSVEQARGIARSNKEKFGTGTILFYDEANTTSAIFAIKEVVCDFTIDGDDFKDSQLQIVAACNPYKRLSNKAVKQLEESGLGYNTKASDTEQIGKIPMRRLVYRVVSLPPSMQPFVWDFGQLGRDAEEIYIKQMTQRETQDMNLSANDINLINAILFRAQYYMRNKGKDESRYVSLRDVERSLKTFRWFHKHAEHIFPLIKEWHKDDPRKPSHDLVEMPNVLRSLLHTVSVCYHSSLNDRKSFREEISKVLRKYSTPLSESEINLEIIGCQTIFANNLKMDDNIACNEALRENVFLISVCADLRMPLFIVGKPGSSKSLAKTIVADNMQGKSSYSDLYKTFKQVHVLSYQCSGLTDAKGIESIFNQCAQLQANQDIESYTAVVVLDEIGLAEDSPNMPLKVLHPLLECGSTMNGTLTEFDEKKKVGFVGISNWALDPAKMNRGIFVTRSSPNKNDLKKTAEGIFENQTNRMNLHLKEIGLLTDAYMEIYKEQTREYFGLRDYYSLIKMLHSTCKGNDQISKQDIEQAIQRNFSGGEQEKLSIFQRKLGYENTIKEIPVQRMVLNNLKEDKSRFLLLLANQYSSFSLLQNFIPDFHQKVQVIFGSSFPNDHNYTEMCRNINRVKVCMEAGRTVILLNMTEINESLYDALNQHYVTLGGQRYVDLGLGGHRVKCRIADGFRLIVIEIKEKVYNDYPIPLINRLEKHHLTSNSLLTVKQRLIAEKLSEWINDFSQINGLPFTASDSFVGHHDDSASSIVISYKPDIDQAKQILLQSATMDAVFRLARGKLSSEHREVKTLYVENQVHDNLWKLLEMKLKETKESAVSLITVTSFSNILTDTDRQDLETLLDSGPKSIMLLSLQQFQTEQDYLKKLEDFFKLCNKKHSENPNRKVAILLIQCPQAHNHGQLISCARYGLLNKLEKIVASEKKIVIAFLLSTERRHVSNEDNRDAKTLVLQHNSNCDIVYVDELRPTFKSLGLTTQYYDKTICDVMKVGKNSISPKNEQDDLGIHMPTLLLDCACEAMTKVKSRVQNNNRNLERIKVLSELCSQNSEVNYAFLDILISKMIQIFEERQDEVGGGQNWIVEEACSAEKLQEGGTFAKTLWLCLKRHVSKMIAYIMSKIDRNNNLDIITSTKEQDVRMQEMWIAMFKAYKLRWEDMRGLNEFMIPDQKVLHISDDVRIPFSFLIYEAMSEQWSALDGEHREVEKRKIFFKHFCSSNSEIEAAISDALRLRKPISLIKAFAEYIIYETYTTDIGCTQKMSDILVETAMILKKMLRDEKDLPGCHMFLFLFYCSKIFKDHYQVIHDILKLCPHVIDLVNTWIAELKKVDALDDFKVHQSALCSVLEYAKKTALAIKDADSCISWMELTRTLSKIFYSTFDLICKPADKIKLKKDWEPLAMLDLLLLHLLPNPSTDSDNFKNYVEIVASQARLIYKGTSKSGIKNEQFLKILCNALRKYYEEITVKIIVSWQNPTCRICRKKTCKLPTVLPCKHYFCCDCISNTFAGSSKKCQICSFALPDDYTAIPSTLTGEQTKELSAFQSNCTSFFLEYLSQFVLPIPDVFQHNNNDMDHITHLVFNELVLKICPEKPEFEKSALHLNIAACSNILSILLQANTKLTEQLVDDCLNEAKNPNRDHLILVCIMTYEQHFIKHFSNGQQNSNKKYKHLLTNFIEMREKIGPRISSKILQCVAGARYAITRFVQSVQENEETSKDRFPNDKIESVKRMIQLDDSGVLKDFFIKLGCHRYGIEWFAKIANLKDYKALLPPKLIDRTEVNVDFWNALGKDYSAILSELNKSTSSSRQKQLGKWFPPNQPRSTNFLKMLAVSSWLISNPNHLATITNYFDQSCQENAKILDMLCSLNTNIRAQMQHLANISGQQKAALQQIVVLAAGVIQSQILMTKEMRELITEPNKVAKLYWPAMPESFYFSIPHQIRQERGVDAMYRCPNGHIYTIGNCTRPVTISRCPDCNAIIGGKSYVAQAGNVRIKLEESSQAGYVLNSLEKNLQKPEDRISMQASSIIQLLIHACMFSGLKKQSNAMTALVSDCNQQNIDEYLVQQMQKNLNDFKVSLGRNTDEAMLVILQIFLCILKIDPNGGQQIASASWNSIESRKQWEKLFREVFLLPVFQNMEKSIDEAQQNLNDAEDMTSIALFRHVHEVKEEGEVPRQHDILKDFHLWLMIQHSNASHLMQCIRDSSDHNSGKVLQLILETPDIHLLLHLEEVLKLQKSLIKKYQNQLDLAQAENITLQDFRNVANSSSDFIAEYIKLWAELRHTLKSSGECDSQMNEWLNEDISMDSPISVALPSIRGRGRCAKLLAEHLIKIQNQFLNKCLQIEGINASANEVEISELLHSHYVCIDKQKDLLPLIQLHTSYVVTEDAYGRHHKISYNINALEKQARENFVKYKKLIKLDSLPYIRYVQDIGIGSDWDKVIMHTKLQEPLSPKLRQNVDDLVLNSTPADVCEGVRTLTHAISFLAKVECSPSSWLCEYLEKDLLLPRTRAAVIPRFAKIHHTLALYQYLSWHKSVNFVKQGLKPYNEVLHQVVQEDIIERKVLNKLKEAFQHMDVILFQQRINEMLIKVPDYKEDWSLVDDIFPYLQFIDNDSEEEWFSRIPDVICFKHVSHLFELAVKHVQNNN